MPGIPGKYEKLSYLKQTFLLSYLCVTGGNIIISGFLSSFLVCRQVAEDRKGK